MFDFIVYMIFCPRFVVGTCIGLLMAGGAHWVMAPPEPVPLEAFLFVLGCVGAFFGPWFLGRSNAKKD
jgi:hypothetical protein